MKGIAVQRISLVFAAVVLLAPLVVATQTEGPVVAPWVDPNQIQGRLLASVETYVGFGMTAFGTVTDPQGTGLEAAWTAPAGAACSLDPNTLIWEVTWWPVAADVGIHYVVMRVSEKSTNQPKVLTDTATLAVRVLAERKPPVIHYGGCRILSK